MASPTRRLTVTLRTGEVGANTVAGRPLQAFWLILAPHFRDVLLAPHRRVDDSGIVWSWTEATERGPLTAGDRQTIRRGLEVGLASLADASEPTATHEPHRLALLRVLTGQMTTVVKHLRALPDPDLDAFVAHTPDGLRLHSWGAHRPGTPHVEASPNASVLAEAGSSPQDPLVNTRSHRRAWWLALLLPVMIGAGWWLPRNRAAGEEQRPPQTPPAVERPEPAQPGPTVESVPATDGPTPSAPVFIRSRATTTSAAATKPGPAHPSPFPRSEADAFRSRKTLPGTPSSDGQAVARPAGAAVGNGNANPAPGDGAAAEPADTRSSVGGADAPNSRGGPQAEHSGPTAPAPANHDPASSGTVNPTARAEATRPPVPPAPLPTRSVRQSPLPPVDPAPANALSATSDPRETHTAHVDDELQREPSNLVSTTPDALAESLTQTTVHSDRTVTEMIPTAPAASAPVGEDSPEDHPVLDEPGSAGPVEDHARSESLRATAGAASVVAAAPVPPAWSEGSAHVVLIEIGPWEQALDADPILPTLPLPIGTASGQLARVRQAALAQSGAAAIIPPEQPLVIVLHDRVSGTFAHVPLAALSPGLATPVQLGPAERTMALTSIDPEHVQLRWFAPLDLCVVVATESTRPPARPHDGECRFRQVVGVQRLETIDPASGRGWSREIRFSRR